MSPPDQPAPPAEARDLVEDDTTCTKCGYNLRTLSRDGTCPECGLAVAESSPGPVRVVPREARARMFRRGFTAILTTLMLGVVTTFALGSTLPIWRYKALAVAQVCLGVSAMPLLSALIVIYISFRNQNIRIGHDIIMLRQNNEVIRLVRRNEITQVFESSVNGLCVHTANRLHRVSVPPEIEGYDAIRATLAEWSTIERDEPAFVSLIRESFYCTLVFTAVTTTCIGKNPTIAAIAMLVGTGLFTRFLFWCMANPGEKATGKWFWMLMYTSWLMLCVAVIFGRI